MRAALHSRNLAEPVRRRVELAVAVAQERLLATHVEHALDLLELIGEHIPFDDGLAIYTRLLRLSNDETRVIATRALAILGERAADGDPWPELAVAYEPEAAEPARGPFALVHHVRQRVRGRVNEELRKWIEVSAAATEVAILGTHVNNALYFVDILDKDLPFNEAIELYLDCLDVRDSVAEVAYYTAVASLRDRVLPRKRAPAAEERGRAPLRATPQRSVMRVVDAEDA